MVNYLSRKEVNHLNMTDTLLEKEKETSQSGAMAGEEDMSLLKERYEAIWDVGPR
jgi:hypothetical protein